MTSAIQVTIGDSTLKQLVVFLKAYHKFATILSINISASSDLHFSVINENGSAFSSLRLPAIRLHRQLSSQIDPNDAIFTKSYREPLKTFLFHVLQLSNFEISALLLQFTQDSLHFGSELCEGFSGTLRSLLQPTSLEHPIYPPLEAFPVQICGISPDWFNFLLDGIASPAALSKSTLILKASQSTGLTLLLPGTNSAEIQLGHFNFNSFKFPENDENVSVMISLREFSALNHLASKLGSLIDFYFGPIGYPLIVNLTVASPFECKFVMATVPCEQRSENENVTNVEDYVSGTEDEEDDVKLHYY